MKRVVFLVLITSLSAWCFAPIEDKPAGAKFYPEQSDQQLERQQSQTGAVNQVGEVVVKERTRESAAVESDASAANAVAASESTIEGRNTLIQAEKKLEDGKKTPLRMGLLGFGVLGLGFCLVLGLRKYASKAAPEMPVKRNFKW